MKSLFGHLGDEMLLLRHALSTLLNELRGSRRSKAAAAFLLSAALSMVVLTVAVHVWQLATTGTVEVPLFLNLGADGSLGEITNYAQAGLCSLVLLVVFFKTKALIVFVLSLTFAFIVADDAFQYHERFGGDLRRLLDLPAAPGLRAKDTGEVLAWVVGGAALAVPFLLSLRQNAPQARGYAYVILLCFGTLLFCGIALDMLHVLTGSDWIGYLEDGGEMLAIALAASCAVTMLGSPLILAEIADRRAEPISPLAWFSTKRAPAEDRREHLSQARPRTCRRPLGRSENGQMPAAILSVRRRIGRRVPGFFARSRAAEEIRSFPVASEPNPNLTEIQVRTFGLQPDGRALEGPLSMYQGNPGFVEVADARYFPGGEGFAHTGLYHGCGTPIPESLLYRSQKRMPKSGLRPRDSEPPEFESEDRPAIYLGYLDAHFGHTITEFLSRFWIFDPLDARDHRLVVHSPFDGSYPRWLRELFALADVPIDNLQVYRRPVRLRSVIVPRQGLVLGSHVWSAALKAIARVGARAGEPPARRGSQPLYLSRLALRPPTRRLQGEADLIDYLERRNVRVVSPETLTLAEQIRLFMSHDCFIGPWGSAHHINLFTQRPSHHVYLSHIVRPTYVLLDAAFGNQSDWVGVKKLRKGKKSRWSQVDDLVRLPVVTRALKKIGI